MAEGTRIEVTPADWRAAADEATEHAVGWLHQPGYILGRAGALNKAAQLLRDADTFRGHANTLEITRGIDSAIIEE